MLATALVFCVLAATPQGEEPRSEERTFTHELYSFQCPDDWLLLSKETIADVRAKVKDIAPAFEQVDFGSVDACVVRPVEGEGSFTPNVNFVRTNSRMPVSDSHVDELRDTMTQQFAEHGVQFREPLAVTVTAAGAVPCYRIDYVATLPTSDDVLRQRQLMIPIGGTLLTVTCSATEQQFAENEPKFAAVLSSLRIDPAAMDSPFWVRMLWMTAVGAVLGGIVGGAVKLLQRRKAASRGAV